MTFSERLKELRISKGLSQMELSIKTGLSQSAIAKWELNKTEPTASALITLSKFFGEPSAEYFAGANKGLNFILEKLIGNETFFSFANPTFFSIFVGAMICFFVGNYFAINKKENLKTNSIEKQQMLDVNIRTLIWTRFIKVFQLYRQHFCFH